MSYTGSFGLIANFWNVDLIAGTESTVGDSFAGAILSIGITLLLAYTLWLIVEVLLGRYKVDDGADAHVDSVVRAVVRRRAVSRP
jgi:uncharacterized membrane protein